MLPREAVILPEELQVLLFHTRTRIRVDYVPTNIQLFDVQPYRGHYEVSLYCEPEDFTVSTQIEEWIKEHPRYGDLLQCFLAAGLVNYPNIGELQRYVQAMRNLKREVVYVPDTNLLYNHFLSSTGILEPGEVVLTDLSQKEILASSNHKFTGRDLDEVKREIKYHGSLYDELINRRKKASRRAYNLALSEYREYQVKASNIIHVEEFSRDKEKNDKYLVEAVDGFFKERNIYPVVLTCDALLQDVLETYGLEYFKLEPPQRISPELAAPRKIIRLLSLLSEVFGFVKMENMVLYGEYRGKNPGELKLSSLSGELNPEIIRDLKICRELSSLNIPF